MRVLVADKFEKSGLDGLAAAGCEVLFEPDVSEDVLTDRIGASGGEALVVRRRRAPRRGPAAPARTAPERTPSRSPSSHSRSFSPSTAGSRRTLQICGAESGT